MTQTVKHRNSRQRQVIMEELSRLKTHPTASDLYEVVRKRIPNISIGTVYRNLEFLTEAGKVRKLTLVGEQARFDGDISDHLHIRCDECGRVDDFDFETAKSAVKCPEYLQGYKILGCRIEFQGICPDCLKKEHGEK